MSGHGLTHDGEFATYTDLGGDQLHVSAVDDDDENAAVALNITTSGGLVYVDAAHEEEIIAALRAKFAEARSRFGGSRVARVRSTALQELTEVFAEGGHGDDAERHALDLFTRYRAELAAEEAVMASL